MAFRFPEGRHGTGELRYINDLPVLTVQGGPDEIGEAVGALALRPAQRMTTYPEDLLRYFRVGWLKGPLTWLGERMIRLLSAERLHELEAMQRTSGVERRRLVVGNTLFDIKKIIACSTLLVEPQRSATGATLMGRNLDYPSMGYAHEYSLVTVYRQPGKKAFASVGFPGLLGCLSGMNEAGLALAVLEVPQAPLFTRRLDRGGTPYAVCFRRLLEECATVEEARDLLATMRRTTFFHLALVDKQRTAILEVTTRHVRERRAVRGACLATNHFCSDELRPLCTINFYQTKQRLEALRRAEAACERFGVAELHEALHEANQGGATLQTMVFEPEALRLHLAIGDCPASAGPLRALELGELFGSPAPPETPKRAQQSRCATPGG
jgi:hypothetical protein